MTKGYTYEISRGVILTISESVEDLETDLYEYIKKEKLQWARVKLIYDNFQKQKTTTEIYNLPALVETVVAELAKISPT